jgi:Zn-dependent protease with chaperone function
VSELPKGLALGLVWFLAVSVVASALAPALARPWLEPRAVVTAGRRARALFALRLLPSVASVLALLALFVPAYLAHEPRGCDETVGLPLLALAILGGLVLVSAARRGLRAWSGTRRLARAWAEDAEPVDLAVAGLPAYRITHPFPVVAVLGVRHPRLYVASQVLSELGEPELRAVLEHERAHIAARDNLRHWLLRACPDVLAWTTAGGRLDRAWRAAAEEAADERVARGGPGAALVLAAALVRVARLAPPACPALLPGLALHRGDDLARRIRRLVGAPAPPGDSPRSVALLAGLLPLAALPFYPAALRVVHALTESLLALLSFNY